MRMIVGFLRKALVLQVRFTLTASPTPQSLHFLPHHFYPFSSSSTSISTSERSESFTVSYLIDSCGLSHKDALSASKLLRFETPKNPIRSLPSSTAMASPNPKPQKSSNRYLDYSHPIPTKPFCPNSNSSTPKALPSLMLPRS
ncbi:hypothetical protein CK203_085229 [Vitis vinifera]|uniref:Uncharacterized protein n=1 Tax=Vitis vinifera TaxID=29760 RepID=A0A438F6T3_VITVI|nr:hypothetical protein CK203_085229 [Vitis vinifera]